MTSRVVETLVATISISSCVPTWIQFAREDFFPEGMGGSEKRVLYVAKNNFAKKTVFETTIFEGKGKRLRPLFMSQNKS
jgi:hypothetical protein